MIDETEDIALDFGDESYSKKKRFKHPLAAFFHVAFRALAILIYFILNLLTDSFITGFIIIVLLLSFDFWVVKNISGRLLVGLRWWNFIDENGNSQWRFEARKKKVGEKSKVVPVESRLFWLALAVFPVLWVLLFIVALVSFKFHNILIVLVALTLTSANLVGYIKCKKDAGSKVRNMAGSFLGKQLFTQMLEKAGGEAEEE